MAPDPEEIAKLNSLVDLWATLPNSCPSAKTNLPLNDSISDLRKRFFSEHIIDQTTDLLATMFRVGHCDLQQASISKVYDQ